MKLAKSKATAAIQKMSAVIDQAERLSLNSAISMAVFDAYEAQMTRVQALVSPIATGLVENAPAWDDVSTQLDRISAMLTANSINPVPAALSIAAIQQMSRSEYAARQSEVDAFLIAQGVLS